MLNDAKLRSAKPRDKAYKLTDSHRLYLLVKPNGGKLWRWNYAYGGKQKSMHFGIYPMVSLVEARTKRNEARAILSEGKDPAIVNVKRRSKGTPDRRRRGTPFEDMLRVC